MLLQMQICFTKLRGQNHQPCLEELDCLSPPAGAGHVEGDTGSFQNSFQNHRLPMDGVCLHCLRSCLIILILEAFFDLASNWTHLNTSIACGSSDTLQIVRETLGQVYAVPWDAYWSHRLSRCSMMFDCCLHVLTVLYCFLICHVDYCVFLIFFWPTSVKIIICFEASDRQRSKSWRGGLQCLGHELLWKQQFVHCKVQRNDTTWSNQEKNTKSDHKCKLHLSKEFRDSWDSWFTAAKSSLAEPRYFGAACREELAQVGHDMKTETKWNKYAQNHPNITTENDRKWHKMTQSKWCLQTNPIKRHKMFNTSQLKAWEIW